MTISPSRRVGAKMALRAPTTTWTCPAAGDGVPVLVAFGVFHTGVEDGDAGEAGGEAADGLGGEGDFGDQDDGAFVSVDDLFDGADVDFGFAGAGDTVD